MFLALHRSLVDAPFFGSAAAGAAADPGLPPRAAPSSSSPSPPSAAAAAAAAEAAAAVDAAVEPAAAAAAESGAAHHSATSSTTSPSVVRLSSGLAAAVATEPNTRAAEADSFPVLRACVLFVGSISNEGELAREYSFEMATGDPDEDDLASTFLDLYGRDFADEAGDSSDEPAALLSMLKGSWALAVVAERASAGSCAGLHVIVARSSSNGNGKKEGAKKEGGDEMEEEDDDDESGEDAPSAAALPPPPLFWGVNPSNPECLIVSSTPQRGLTPFPAGCFYESSPAPSSSSSEGDGGKKNANWRLDQFSRRSASKSTREVLVAVPSPRGGGGGAGTGIIRPLRYKTRSGKDLKVVE